MTEVMEAPVKESKAVAKSEVVETGIVASQAGQSAFSITNLDMSKIDLSAEANTVQEIELASAYWTPEEKGESKLVIFLGIQDREVFDEESGELTESLKTVNFATLVNGAVSQMSNSSKRLVGIFNNEMFQPGMKFQVTYVGKKKSTKTGHNFDDWSVKPVVSKK